MKKIFTTSLLIHAAIAFSVAQLVAPTNLYQMKNAKDAEYVLKALSLELKFTEKEMQRVNDLLVASARSQEEQSKRATTAEQINVMMIRQTMHIENSLKEIIGSDRYNTYLQKKTSIETKLEELKKS